MSETFSHHLILLVFFFLAMSSYDYSRRSFVVHRYMLCYVMKLNEDNVKGITEEEKN